MTSHQRPYQNGRRRAVSAITAVPLAFSTAWAAQPLAPADLDKLVSAASSEGALAVNSIVALMVESECMKKYGAERPRR